MDAITSFSYKPLRLSFALFCFSSCVAGIMAFFMLLSKNSVNTAGFAVAASVFFVGGMLLLCLGVAASFAPAAAQAPDGARKIHECVAAARYAGLYPGRCVGVLATLIGLCASDRGAICRAPYL